MVWLQENWIIAVVGLLVAILLAVWLLRRKKPEDLAPPAAAPAKPAKPLEPVKPEIIAAEPARFKPLEPKPQPVAPAAPPPVPQPAAKAPPAPEPAPAPKPAPIVEPVAEATPPKPKPVAKPKAAAKPAAEKSTAKPATKVAKKTPAKPAPAEAAPPIPEEPAAPPPAPEPVPAPASAPATATADNLRLLKGVGPKMVTLLGGLGVTSFQQIADWTDADIAAIDPQLGAFQGRIARDNLVDQASYLARGDKAGFEAKYGALGGEL